MAKVIRDDVTVTKSHQYKLKYACDKLLNISSALNERKSMSVIECMGEKFKTNDFCLKEHPASLLFIRSHIKRNEITCLFGKSVHLEIECKKTDKFCEKAEFGCEYLREDFANQLVTAYKKIKNEDGKKYLHCLFQKRNSKHLEI